MDFGTRVAFCDFGGRQQYCTDSQHEFLGRNGSVSWACRCAPFGARGRRRTAQAGIPAAPSL